MDRVPDRSKGYSPIVRERAVGMVMEQEGDYLAQWVAIRAIAKKIRCNRETLRRWTPRAETDAGHREARASKTGDQIKELKRKNREGLPATWTRRRGAHHPGTGQVVQPSSTSQLYRAVSAHGVRAPSPTRVGPRPPRSQTQPSSTRPPRLGRANTPVMRTCDTAEPPFHAKGGFWQPPEAQHARSGSSR